MRRRICLLVLLMLCAACRVFAEATEPVQLLSGDWRYVLLPDGTAEIAGYDGTAEEVTIPAEVDGHAVTRIGHYAFYQNESLQTVTVPEGVTAIGDWAFGGCFSLRRAVLPRSVSPSTRV